jgi:hypothetical protein
MSGTRSKVHIARYAQLARPCDNIEIIVAALRALEAQISDGAGIFGNRHAMRSNVIQEAFFGAFLGRHLLFLSGGFGNGIQ